MVRRLLEAGADPNAALLAGETPVMVAARSGYPAVVEQLMAKGGNVNAHAARAVRQRSCGPWRSGIPDVVKVLLARARRHPCAIGRLERGHGGAAAWPSSNTTARSRTAARRR